MKLLFISKYPPMEGGVSAGNYWLARGLGEKGVEVSFITNSFRTEAPYLEQINPNDLPTREFLEPKNVHLYSIKNPPPVHIPYSEAYLSRLVNLGLKAIDERGADIIYAHYLEPYGAAAFILKKITGLPVVLRHAGSDIYRMLKSPDFRYFLGRVCIDADALTSSRSLNKMWHDMGIPSQRIHPIQDGIDENAFSPHGTKMDLAKEFKIPPHVPTIVYMGKAGKDKGIMEALQALELIRSDFRFLFVSNGKNADDYKKYALSNNVLKEKFIDVGFLPPWRIPELLRSVSLVLHLEYNFPIPIHGPRQPKEAIMCETPIILSEEMYNKIKTIFPKHGHLLTSVKDPSDIKSLADSIDVTLSNYAVAKKHAGLLRTEYLEINKWDQKLAKYINLFESVKKNKRFLFF